MGHKSFRAIDFYQQMVWNQFSHPFSFGMKIRTIWLMKRAVASDLLRLEILQFQMSNWKGLSNAQSIDFDNPSTYNPFQGLVILLIF